MIATPRKFHLRSYSGRHTVYEIMPRGERAVSPSYGDKADADTALATLKENPHIPRIIRTP